MRGDNLETERMKPCRRLARRLQLAESLAPAVLLLLPIPLIGSYLLLLDCAHQELEDKERRLKQIQVSEGLSGRGWGRGLDGLQAALRRRASSRRSKKRSLEEHLDEWSGHCEARLGYVDCESILAANIRSYREKSDTYFGGFDIGFESWEVKLEMVEIVAFLVALPFCFCLIYMALLFGARWLTGRLIRRWKNWVDCQARLLLLRPFEPELAKIAAETVRPVLGRFGEVVIVENYRGEDSHERPHLFRVEVKDALDDRYSSLRFFDENWRNGVREQIESVDWVVVDVSHPTPNVYWEFQTSLSLAAEGRVVLLAHRDSPVVERMSAELFGASSNKRSKAADRLESVPPLILYDGTAAGKRDLHESLGEVLHGGSREGTRKYPVPQKQETDSDEASLIAVLGEALSTTKTWVVNGQRMRINWRERVKSGIDLDRTCAAAFGLGGMICLSSSGLVSSMLGHLLLPMGAVHLSWVIVSRIMAVKRLDPVVPWQPVW